MDASSADRWSLVAGLAAEQHGRVTTRQLREIGLGKGSIEDAVRSGRLHREHVGVFAVGHRAESQFGRWHSAVLACGTEAVLSHRCAASAYRIRDGEGPRVDVTTANANGRGRPGIHAHQAVLAPNERWTFRGIPVTSPARTLVDLAHELDDEDELTRAVREAQYRKLFHLASMELAVRSRPSRLISVVLEDLSPTRSPLEDNFLKEVVKRHRLPPPLCQQKVEGFTVDFLWPAARLIAEADGANHRLPAVRQDDNVRDNILGLAGYLVLRFTKADIHRRHARSADLIRTGLRTRTAA